MAVKKTENNEQVKVNLNFKREKDRKMVKGVFKFYEAPGASLTFNYRAYKGDPVETFTLVDGKMYTLPLGVARHLNSGGYPEYEYIKGEPGTTQSGLEGAPMRIAKTIKRFGFQSLEFMDVDDMGDADQNKIVLVEKTV